MDWKYYIECGLLTIEVPKNYDKHVFSEIVNKVIIESRGLHLTTESIEKQIERTKSIYRLARMAIEVSTTQKISNVSFEDAQELAKLKIEKNVELIKILNAYRFDLTHEPKNYAILADQTAKNLNAVLTA